MHVLQFVFSDFVINRVSVKMWARALANHSFCATIVVFWCCNKNVGPINRTIYTVSQKKTRHYTFVRNIIKC